MTEKKQTTEIFEEKDETEPSAMEPEFIEEPVKVEPEKKIVLTKEQIESRQRAHDIKVQKSIAGGEF